MASVRKLVPKDPKSPWVCEYTDAGGKRRRITPKTGLKKDAEAHKRRIEAELDQGIHQASSESPTVAQAAREYLIDCDQRWKRKDMTGNTFRAYEGVCRLHIVPHFGPRKLSDLTTAKIDAYLLAKIAEGRRPTAQNVHTVMWNMLKFAVRKKWVKRNCLQDERITADINAAPEIVVPSIADINALMAVLNKRPELSRFLSQLNRAVLITLGIFGGLRRGEIAGLQWENVDFEAGVIRIRHSLSIYDGLKAPKTEAGNRTVYMTPQIRAALIGVARYWIAREAVDVREIGKSKNTYNRRIQSAISRMDDNLDFASLSGFVMRCASGRHYGLSSMWIALWTPAMKEAGLLNAAGYGKFSMHAMRHAAASLFIQSGLNSFHLKHAIGHKKESMTYDTYGHLFPEDSSIRDAAHAIAARFDATQTRLPPIKS